MKIAVTSKSFSRNTTLKKSLQDRYGQVVLNDQGIGFNDETLVDFLKDCDRAIIGLEKVTDKVLSRLPNLKVISKYGVGVDNIDFQALIKHQVLFGYTPGTNKRGVAELALQMMLVVLRKSYQCNLNLRKGIWSPEFGQNLTGKTVGILGLGNVGQELVRLLQPFQCKILAHDIQPQTDFIQQFAVEHVDLKSLFQRSQILSIHVPLNTSTKKMVSQNLIETLPEGAILINTARGGIVEEAALLERLKTNKLAAAAFDVFETEPVLNSELISLNNFFSTPHIGGSSVESVLAMGYAAIEGLEKAKPVSDLKMI